jgi:hypothetical protein
VQSHHSQQNPPFIVDTGFLNLIRFQISFPKWNLQMWQTYNIEYDAVVKNKLVPVKKWIFFTIHWPKPTFFREISLKGRDFAVL